jgi:hypothetical protein
MNNVTVNVSGYGVFVIPAEKVQELLNWLASNQGARLAEKVQRPMSYKGKDLLNG